MSNESRQHWLDRNRPPRVQITYDVETLGSSERKELPLVVGILAALMGDAGKGAPKLKERKFVQIDRDNFDAVMEQLRPWLNLGGMAGQAGLTFTKLEDFHPLRIAQQSPRLNKLLRERQRLVDLVAKISSNDSLNDDFQLVFKANLGTKAVQTAKRRQPFHDALQAAQKLRTQASELSKPLQAITGVIHASGKAHRVQRVFDRLMALIPKASDPTLQQAIDAYVPKGDTATKNTLINQVKTFLGGIVDPGADRALNALLGEVVAKAEAAPDANDAAFTAALTKLKDGPTKALDLQRVKDLETKAKAFLAAKTDVAKREEFDNEVKALRAFAGVLPQVLATLKDLEEAASISKTDQDQYDVAVADADADAKAGLAKLPNGDDIRTKAAAYGKKPSQPAELLKEIKTAFASPLPTDLDLSQATELRQRQQEITTAAEDRAKRAVRLDIKEQDKANAAHRKALRSKEAAERIDRLATDLKKDLASGLSPEKLEEQLNALPARAEEIRSAAEAAATDIDQQLQDTFPSSSDRA